MYRISVLALLAVTACSTPQERCISGATKDLRTLNGLISTTQRNINRGFALETEQFLDTEEQLCGVVDGQKVFCEVAVSNSREVPRAIDLNLEQAKLDSLLQKRTELQDRSNAIIAECQRRHPEG